MHYDFRHRRIRFGDCRRDARQVRMTLIVHRNRCAIFRSARSPLQRLITRRSYNETVTWYYCVTRSKLRTHSEAKLWHSARPWSFENVNVRFVLAYTAQRFHVYALNSRWHWHWHWHYVVQGHSTSLIFIPIEIPYMRLHILVNNTNLYPTYRFQLSHSSHQIIVNVVDVHG